MGMITRVLPLLVVAGTIACTSPSTGATEDRAGTVAATITSSPSSAGDGTGGEGSAGVGTDGRDGQDGRSARGNDVDGTDSGTPPTSSRGPGAGSFSVTNNDVMIGAAFANRDIYSFGSTSTGSTTTRSMSVGGGADVTVTSVEVISTTGTFRLVDDGCTGVRFPGSCRVTVAATPPAAGEHEGVLKIFYTTEADEHRSSGRDLTVSGSGSEEETAEPEVRQESATETPPTSG